MAPPTFLMLFSMLLILVCNPKVSRVDTNVVSSAHITIINFDVAFVISLIHMLNNNGPKTEPCGMPHVTFSKFDLLQLNILVST